MKPGMDILLCAQEPAKAEDLHRFLQRGGHRTGWHALDGSEPKGLTDYRMVLIDGRHGEPHSIPLCQRFRAYLGERYLPILCVVNDSELATSSANGDGGPDDEVQAADGNLPDQRCYNCQRDQHSEGVRRGEVDGRHQSDDQESDAKQAAGSQPIREACRRRGGSG